MTPEQQGLIEDIAARFIAAAPESDWSELQIDVSIITSISGFVATAIEADESETEFYIDDATDKKILHALGRLREDMAAQVPGRGAWYVLSLRIPREGKPSVDFDYFSKPEFGVNIGDAAFRQDLATFPRNPDNLPEWLGGKPRPKPQPKPAPAATAAAAAPAAAAAAEIPEATPAEAAVPDAEGGDIQLNAEGQPAAPTGGNGQPMDEALAAAEEGDVAAAEVVPAAEPTPEPSLETPEVVEEEQQIPPGRIPPNSAPPAASDEEETPWYENA